MTPNRPPSSVHEESIWLGAAAAALALLIWGLELGSRTTVKWLAAGTAGMALLVLLAALFVLSLTPLGERLRNRPCPARSFLRHLHPLRRLAMLLLPLSAALLVLFVFFPPRAVFEDPLLFTGLRQRLGLLLLCGVAGGLGLHIARPRFPLGRAAILATLLLGFLYRVILYLPEISPSPFTIAWSEASRFYYGSLFHSAALYGEALPLPFLHPSRYLLLSLPFNIPGLPILWHRVWQVLLWLCLTLLSAWALMRRLHLARASSLWIGTLWAALFLFQGPLYYHLTLCLIPLLLWFRRERPWRTLLLVISASLWAGISRINWWPMPAALAVMLWLLEEPRAGQKLPGWFRWPFWWSAAGLVSSFSAHRLYILLSGQPDSSRFSSSFTSDLLWNRLWPSPTYPPGILPMILLLSLPLFLLIALSLRRSALGWPRQALLALIVLVMMAGGLVVSTKIGGGSNLHNMDAFLTLLLVWGAYLGAGRAAPEPAQFARMQPMPGGLPLLLLGLAMPLVPLLQSGQPLRFPDQAALRAEADGLLERVRAVNAAGGRVLFIWQRQLLPFELRGEVPLIYPYETVDLMEMAMANNQPYLEEFYRRLQDHEFSLIISGAQNDVIRPPSDPFSEENNVWVSRVTQPILRWYSPLETLPLSGTQLLEPR